MSRSSTIDPFALLEHTGHGYAVVDTSLRVVFESPANYHIHGYSPRQLVGNRLADFLPPADLALLRDRIRRLASAPLASSHDRIRFRHRQGHWITLDRTLRNCLHDPRINGFLVMFRPAADAGTPPDHTEEFLSRTENFVAAHLHEPQLETVGVARALGLSLRQLQRRLRALTGESPAAFIRRLRLRTAHTHIERRTYATMIEVAASVGLSASYFYRAYRREFGCPPKFPASQNR